MRVRRRHPVSIAVVLLCGLVGCSGSGSSPPPVASAAECRPTSGEGAQGSVASGAVGSSATLGPSSAITPEEAREARGRRGTPLTLSGRVYAADCRTPAAGAVVHVWQTDARGVYGPSHGTEQLRCCYLQGTLETDAEGRFTIETIKPGHYRGDAPPPPAHIHMEIHYRGEGLLTELFFAGDPYLGSGEPEGEVTTLREESGAEGKRLAGRFDIILGG